MLLSVHPQLLGRDPLKGRAGEPGQPQNPPEARGPGGGRKAREPGAQAQCRDQHLLASGALRSARDPQSRVSV